MACKFQADKLILKLNKSEIVQGSAVELRARIQNLLSQEPLNLNGALGATALFLDNVAVTGTIATAQLGELLFSISSEQSAEIESGDVVPVQVMVDLPTGLQVVILDEGLTVREQLG